MVSQDKVKFVDSTPILGLFSLFIIFLFCLISLFNFPISDDFWNYIRVRDFGFLGAQQRLYFGWSGRYASNFFVSLTGLSGGLFTQAKWIPLLLIVTQVHALLVIIGLLLYRINMMNTIIVTLLVYATYLCGMPKVSVAFYWITSGIVYQLGISFFLYFIYFTIKTVKSSSIIYNILAFIFLFITIGFNELLLAQCWICISIFFLFILLKLRKSRQFIIMLVCFAIFASLVAIIAPGNRSRFERETSSGAYSSERVANRHNMRYSIYESSAFLLKHINNKQILVLITLMCGLSLLSDKFECYMNRKNLGILYISVLLSIMGGVFPSFWATGGVQPRVVNVMWFFFVLSLFNLALILKNTAFFKISNWKQRKMLRLFLLFLVILLLGYSLNFRTVLLDIIKGRAHKYAQQQQNRYELIEKCESELCFVPKLTVFAYTLHYTDLAPNVKGNTAVAAYFKKKGIATVEKK